MKSPALIIIRLPIQNFSTRQRPTISPSPRAARAQQHHRRHPVGEWVPPPTGSRHSRAAAAAARARQWPSSTGSDTSIVIGLPLTGLQLFWPTLRPYS